MKYLRFARLFAGVFMLSVFAAEDRNSEPDAALNLVRAWRGENIPAASPEAYWNGLMVLGSQLDETTVDEILKMPEQSIDTLLAGIAYHVWRYPKKIEELKGWYGVTWDQIDENLRNQLVETLTEAGASWRQIAEAGMSPSEGRHVIGVRPLMQYHLDASYAPFWHAWLLSPPQHEPILRRSVPDALKRMKDPGSFGLAAEMFRIAAGKLQAHDDPEAFMKINEEQLKETWRWHDLVYKCDLGDARSTLLLSLEWFRISQRHGIAENGGIDSYRSRLIRLLASRLRYADLSREEFAEYLENSGGTRNFEQALVHVQRPADTRWRSFKPVVEELLRDPAANRLDAEDIRFLEDVLKAMPGEPQGPTR